ncbi:MAG: diaminopimelate epimerase [Eubacterium sp.]|nr:diaminopimelate epimerase [Candidatus Colimonas fimequi]
MIAISKYHGCGNNFVIIRENDLPVAVKTKPEDARIAMYSDLALAVCNINTGVGADGMIIVREDPELEMVFFNQDGSRAPMCGNGIRCFAQYCADKEIRIEAEYPVKTLAGTMVVEVTQDDPFRVKINMGAPNLDPAMIAVETDAPDYLDKDIPMKDGSTMRVDSLFMGTIHTVVFVDDIDVDVLEPIGEEICNHPIYTEKTNVNFVKVVDRQTLEVLTYERGVGITYACGTGACASVVMATVRGYIDQRADVLLKMGTLGIEIGEDGNVYMEGPSVRIFDGELE